LSNASELEQNLGVECRNRSMWSQLVVDRSAKNSGV